jgi:hypothetical protein
MKGEKANCEQPKGVSLPKSSALLDKKAEGECRSAAEKYPLQEFSFVDVR